MNKKKQEIEDEVVKSFAKQSCLKLFDILWNFLKYLFSGERLRILLVLTITFWVITIINIVTGGKLTDFGIQPRDFPFGFLGIFIAPFIHTSLSHVLANTVPFICLGALVMLRGMKVWLFMSITVAISSGFLVWMIGRSNTKHVGASAIVFSYLGYLCTVAFIERHWKSVLIAIVVVFLYGGMLFGIFPGDDRTSWEGHLTGLGLGVASGYLHMNYFDGMVIERPDIKYDSIPQQDGPVGDSI